MTTPPDLDLLAQSIYRWRDLADRFEFTEAYLGAAGGMVSRPSHGVLLLITHPGGAKSFDYDDYWDGPDLVYTGRGKRGDQILEGTNAQVANNSRALLVFEAAGVKKLRCRSQETHCSGTGPLALTNKTAAANLLASMLRRASWRSAAG